MGSFIFQNLNIEIIHRCITINKFAIILQSIDNLITETFGFSWNIGSEKTLAFCYRFFYQFETGIGYSKDFLNGKPVNFYINSGE